ncbi:hypothetical protein OV208_17865 [Corallococcus sp. bb12-1]|uniref:hypothetical protein n=1 Tax=Corallococcus sp. bb12-1 TaxID=2996784 RepID=UPI00226E7F30|nr:hypothetical protein [Corallococcus sp. bb12-1]MCY1043189.1 hypothetical protein [Corallococcus sp. bb12-1]
MCASKKKTAGGKSSVGKKPIPKKSRVKKKENGGDEGPTERRADAEMKADAFKKWHAKASNGDWRAAATALAYQEPMEFGPPEDVTLDDFAGWMEAPPEDVRRWLKLPQDAVWPPKNRANL